MFSSIQEGISCGSVACVCWSVCVSNAVPLSALCLSVCLFFVCAMYVMCECDVRQGQGVHGVTCVCCVKCLCVETPHPLLSQFTSSPYVFFASSWHHLHSLSPCLCPCVSPCIDAGVYVIMCAHVCVDPPLHCFVLKLEKMCVGLFQNVWQRLIDDLCTLRDALLLSLSLSLLLSFSLYLFLSSVLFSLLLISLPTSSSSCPRLIRFSCSRKSWASITWKRHVWFHRSFRILVISCCFSTLLSFLSKIRESPFKQKTSRLKLALLGSCWTFSDRRFCTQSYENSSNRFVRYGKIMND